MKTLRSVVTVLVGCQLLVLAACAGDDPASGEADIQQGSRKVAGFDFEGFRLAPLGGNEICPEMVDAVAETCREAGGTATPVKTCKTLCSLPIAERGKVAGFDFDGFHIAESGGNQICPQVVSAVAETCHETGGKASSVKGCKKLCSLPVADRGKVAGYGFSGPKTLLAPVPGIFCPELVRAEDEACGAAKGRVIEAKDCVSLCSVPIAKR